MAVIEFLNRIKTYYIENVLKKLQSDRGQEFYNMFIYNVNKNKFFLAFIIRHHYKGFVVLLKVYRMFRNQWTTVLVCKVHSQN